MVSYLINRFIKNSWNVSSPAIKEAIAKLCSFVGIGFNLLLFTVKLALGLASGSSALAADGFNNLSDAAAAAASFIGFGLAGIGAGENHRFGHGRYEWLMGFLISLAVFWMGMSLAKRSVKAILHPQPIAYHSVMFAALAVSVLIKLYMYSYNRSIGASIGSSTMKAAAADSISDMVSTSAIIVSLTVQKLTGWNIDGWCGLMVSMFIMVSSVKSVTESVERMLGQSPDKDMVGRIEACAMEHPEIRGISNLTIHDYGMGHYAVSMHIEGRSGDDLSRLNMAAQELSYQLYDAMGCDATIQADLIEDDQAVVEMVSDKVNHIVQGLDANARVKELRIVKNGAHPAVTLIISGSRKLQKMEDMIRNTLGDALKAYDSGCQIITKMVLPALRRGEPDAVSTHHMGPR